MAKVVRYTEEEFVTLLENIVKRVKSEERKEKMNESRQRRLKRNNRRPRA